jgi:EPS-associated MarR family transcriptional regulator
MQEETHLSVLRILESNPEITQRELAAQLGVSLGKVNYCLKALIDKGWIKAKNFKNNNHKAAYAYLLTPHGIEQKTRITLAFLKRKKAEYEFLKKEIEQLHKEVSDTLITQRGE